MPVEVSQKLMTSRYEGDESKKDIHEKDMEYLMKCRAAADYVCKKQGWIRIDCARDGEPLAPEIINSIIYESIEKIL